MFSDDKAGYIREKTEWHKSIARYSKQRKKNGESMGGMGDKENLAGAKP